MKRWMKPLVYEGITLLVLIGAVVLCAVIGGEDLTAAQSGIGRGESLLFWMGCILMGVALTIRKNRDFRADVWFGLIVGIALLGTAVANFWAYGGLTELDGEAGAQARNLLIVCLSLTPIPFLARSGVLAVFLQEERRGRRLAVCGIAAAEIVAYVLFFVFGLLMNTVSVGGAV